jgi:hypothetical protein
LACTNVATCWILSSVLTVLGQPVCSSCCKQSLPCANLLCNLHTALTHGFFALRLLLHLNILLVDLPNLWQNITFVLTLINPSPF